MHINYSLEEKPFIELGKLLKITDLASSGGEAKLLIKDGKVTVDGNVVTQRGAKIKIGSVVKVFDSTVKLLK